MQFEDARASRASRGSNPLICPVRRCGCTLAIDGSVMSCKNGHGFDRSRKGYWNLTQPQDKKSSTPGDSADAVEARHRWIASGTMSHLVDALASRVPNASPTSKATDNHRDSAITDAVATVIDIGCGEGSFGRLLHGETEDQFIGIDLSRAALGRASRAWPDATWILANADRGLPIRDDSVDIVYSMFGRRPIGEIVRVLRTGGIAAICVPAPDDLIELRRDVQSEGHLRDRGSAIVATFVDAGMSLQSRTTCGRAVELDAEQVRDAMAMTYRAGKRSRDAAIDSVDAMTVTVSADVMLFRL